MHRHLQTRREWANGRNAAYDTQGVAAALVERLVTVGETQPSFARLDTLRSRWGVPLDQPNGEDYLQQLADSRFTGDVQRAATTILKDFRSGLMGPLCLELPEHDFEE